MDKTTFRILDALTKTLGRDLSIQDLARAIRRTHGSGYYANIYNRVQALKREGLLETRRTGGATTVSLSFSRYLLIDALAEMEIHRKRAAMASTKRGEALLAAIDQALSPLPQVASASAVRFPRNLKLNRAELLVLLKGAKGWDRIHDALAAAASHHNVKIDFLALTGDELLASLASEERNPAAGMLADAFVVFGPQAFWSALARSERRRLTIQEGETNPARVADPELIHNLERFGYSMMGTREVGARNVCLEYTTIAALLSGSARRRLAAPVILAKNKAHPRTLAFLATRHEVQDLLLGHLEATARFKPNPEVQETIELLRHAGAKPGTLPLRAVEETLRTYHALG